MIDKIKKHSYNISVITGMILHVSFIQFDPLGLSSIHYYLPIIYIPIAWSLVMVMLGISIKQAYSRVNSNENIWTSDDKQD